MRKLILIIFTSLLLLVGCSSGSPITFVDGANIYERFENDETFVFVLGSSTCSACVTYKPVLEELIDNYDVEINYVEIDKVDQDEVAKLNTDFLDESLEWTPTTYVVVEGEVVYEESNVIRYTDLITLFREHSFIE